MARRKGLRAAIGRGFRGIIGRRGRRSLKNWALAAVCVSSLVLVGLLALSPWGCTPNSEPGGFTTLESRTIRVLLAGGTDHIEVTASTPPVYYTADQPTQRNLGLPANSAVPIYYSASGWLCGRTNLGQGQLVLRPAVVGSLAINGVPYRGQFRLVPTGGGRFDVVNEVEIDDYLKGVLAVELLKDWHDPAYRAQAIVARTYALYEKYTAGQERHWDVLPDQRSQVYGGLPAETPRAIAAVDATRGIVVVWGKSGEEHIFKTFFSSCCGGITQNVSDAFPNEPFVPPLSAQRVGPVCSISNRYNWGPVIITKQELTRRLRRRMPSMGTVEGVVIEARNNFGRPTRYRVVDTRGRYFMYNCEDFRVAVNSDSTPDTYLYSSYIENIVNDSDGVRFVGGHGFGHGVGMCQWCAEARARSGISAEDIVLYSFPGARLVKGY